MIRRKNRELGRTVLLWPVINLLFFTENLLANSDVVGSPYPCSLGTAAFCLLVMLTAAFLMASSHSEGEARQIQAFKRKPAAESTRRRSKSGVHDVPPHVGVCRPAVGFDCAGFAGR